jgi:glycosyltransferase involved in cell wall biosynthesis
MTNAAISVLMSVYNGARFLRDAVDSILAQTMPDFEYLIIDDGSTDETAATLASYYDPRIRVVRQENQGLAAALNRGLNLAATDLVARMDADDVAFPERLEVQLAEYERLGRPDVMGSAILLMSEAGHPAGVRTYPVDHDAIARNLVQGGPTLAHPSVLYRRHAVLSCGGYDPAFRSTEDYDLWLRMLGGNRFANAARPLLKYRLRPSSMARGGLGACSDAPVFLHHVAKQRYLLASSGRQDLWNNDCLRQRLMSELRMRFDAAGTARVSAAGRALQVARVELLSPGLRLQGARRVLRSIAEQPAATVRYALTRRVPEPLYLTADDVLALASGQGSC